MSTSTADSQSPARIPMFGVEIDPVRMPEAVSRLMHWIHDDSEFRHRYVVTPNVDHTVMLQEHEGMRAAYDKANLILADGMPVVWASRLLRKPLPERVTGADLVFELFKAANEERPLTAYLLGAMPGVADIAAKKVEARWPAVKIVGTYSPPFGFEKDDAENAAILERIRAVTPDVLVVGLGAPKQELWVHKHRDQIEAKVSLCVGATIDFLAENVPRAPLWMQRCGLEWFYRMMSEPRRLFKRYARDAWIFPRLVWKEWRLGRQKRPV
ncbi:MAG: WecB/TagA/CpsF family glycosyltransferase [Planctomycetaceae bacterium]